VHYEVDPSLEYALVPKLSIQPLVENAIYHGVSQIEEPGIIVVRIYEHSNQIRIEVEDNGVGYEVSEPMTSKKFRQGIGLVNLKERLYLLFKDAGQTGIKKLERGTLAWFCLPLLKSEPFQSEPYSQ
jgi:sensor histidine kinase YesM